MDPGGNETTISIHEANADDDVPHGLKEIGGIHIRTTVAWDNDQRPDFHLSDEEMMAAVTEHGSIIDGVRTPQNPKGGKYVVTFSLDIVPDSETSYNMVMDAGSLRSQVRHRSSMGSNDKLLSLDPEASGRTVAHEFGHLAGANDHYYDDASSGFSKPDHGWEGEIMATGNTFDARSVNEMIRSPYGPRSLAAGVTVRTWPW